MPWFSISPTVVQASSYASQGANFLSQLAGQSTDYSSSLGFDESYNVWSLGKAGEVAVTYQSMYDSASDLASSLSDSYYGDDYSDSGHGHVVGITNPNYGEVSSGGIAFISMAVTAFWALGMLASIAGIVLYLTQGLKVVLPAGCGLMTLSVLAFELLYASSMSAIGSATSPPFLWRCSPSPALRSPLCCASRLPRRPARGPAKGFGARSNSIQQPGAAVDIVPGRFFIDCCPC